MVAVLCRVHWHFPFDWYSSSYSTGFLDAVLVLVAVAVVVVVGIGIALSLLSLVCIFYTRRG